MEYRDDRDALIQRADNLQGDLEAANQRLAEARERIVDQKSKDEEDEKRFAELEDEVNNLRKRLGLQPRPVARKKEESSTGFVVVMLFFVAVALVLVGGVLTFALTSPGADETASSEPPRALPLVVGGAFALFGLPMIGVALSTFGKDRDIAKWPKTTGKVLSSRLDSYTATGKDQNGYYQSYEQYTPEVSYSYSVNGTEYTSSAVARVVECTTDRASVQASVDRYAVGKEVAVLYDPEDPSTAYLEVRRSTGAIIMLCFGLLLTGIGVAVGSIFFAS